MSRVSWLRGVPLRLLLLAAVLQFMLLLPGCSASLSSTQHSSGMQDYHYSLQLESYASRLVYLAEFELGDHGYFDIALDVALTIDTPKSDAGRTMLHLVVCDGAAIRRIKSSSISASSTASSTSSSPLVNASDSASQLYPAYCAMANRTLGDYCLSYPLEDDSHKEDFVYRAQKTLYVNMRETAYDGVGTLYFLLDACETVGGEHGVLRSCLDQPGSKTSDTGSTCFYCPKNYPQSATSSAPSAALTTCSVPPQIKPHVVVSAAMNLCNERGECLDDDARKSFLPIVFALFGATWAASAVVWRLHIRSFPDAVVTLQARMALVPVAQAAYTTMTCLTLYCDSRLVGTARSFVINLTVLAQLGALTVSAEVLVLIAKGWQITRPALPARERQWIRFVTLLWATSYVVLRTSVVKHAVVFLIWGVAWAVVVFLIWYNSAFNMNMLKYQIAMVRQMGMPIDHVRTPVYTKYLLFRRFRGLLGLYMFLACVFGILGLVNGSASSPTWHWSSVVVDETLHYLLFLTLGYTFRCRRFRNLLHTAVPLVVPVPAAAHGGTTSIMPAPPTEVDIPQQPTKRKPMLVVVLSPNQTQALGTTYQVLSSASSGSSGSPVKVAAACSPNE